MTVKDLANISGISESSLNKIIGGFNTNPGYTTVLEIAHSLNLTLDELIDLLDLEIDYQNNISNKFYTLTESEQNLIEIIIDYFLYTNRNKHYEFKLVKSDDNKLKAIPLENTSDFLIAASGLSENMSEEEKELLRQDIEDLKNDN